jgi:hypothetical protein
MSRNTVNLLRKRQYYKKKVQENKIFKAKQRKTEKIIEGSVLHHSKT